MISTTMMDWAWPNWWRKGEVNSSELVEEAISRIETRNPQINAVVFKIFEFARATAAARSAGPFAGVPFLLKDRWLRWPAC